MAENTKIEWATHTFNPWRGCTKLSEGCRNCYADTMSRRNPLTLGVWGPSGTRVVASEEMWGKPAKWNAIAELAAELAADLWKAIGGDPARPGEIAYKGAMVRHEGRPRVFCASLADVFEHWTGPMSDASGNRLHAGAGLIGGATRSEWWYSESPCDETPTALLTMDDVRRRLTGLVDATPHLDWLWVTKRPENVLRMTFDAWCKRVPGHVSQNAGDGRRWMFPPNVWLGTSVENRKATVRIDALRAAPAAVRFLSIEPLLEDLGTLDLTGIHWVIVGGESGPQARPMHPDWARSVRDQCQSAGVAFFFKQWGEWRPVQSSSYGDPRDPKSNAAIEGINRVAMLRDGRYCLRDDGPSKPKTIMDAAAYKASTEWLMDESGRVADPGYQWMARMGKANTGRKLDGREWNELPITTPEAAA